MMRILRVTLTCLFLLQVGAEAGSLHKDSVIKLVQDAIHQQQLSPTLGPLPEFWSHGRIERLDHEERDLTCLACEAAVDIVIDAYLSGQSIETIEEELANLCILIGLTGALANPVCRGAIYSYGPILEYVFQNTDPLITSQEVCGAILWRPENPCGAGEKVHNWTVSLGDTPKPPVEDPVLPDPGSPTKKVLHITDIHLDLTYTIGSNAACNLEMCCGNTSGPASSPQDEAGPWGHWGCDPPAWSFHDMLSHIAAEHGEELDYIMISGDYPAHDIWVQSQGRNLETVKTVLDYVLEIFPNTQVIPALGNHEPFPCNILPGTTTGVADTDFDPDWLLSEMSSYFMNWLPEEQVQQFREFAGYSFLLREGFRIISVPSPLCLTYNFASFVDFSDPGNVLEWLVSELTQAESAGEKVHILCHVPSGGADCLGSWGREFGKIISRFENTVMAQFNGHTHNDEFVVFYDPSDLSRATNIAFVTPSVSTYAGLNMGYRLYTVDATGSYRVTDTETYVFDMGAANQAGQGSSPHYFKLYSALSDLEMTSLLPGDFDLLVKRLNTEEDFYNKWRNYYVKAGPSNDGIENKREQLCDMITTSNIHTEKCTDILGLQN